MPGSITVSSRSAVRPDLLWVAAAPAGIPGSQRRTTYRSAGSCLSPASTAQPPLTAFAITCHHRPAGRPARGAAPSPRAGKDRTCGPQPFSRKAMIPGFFFDPVRLLSQLTDPAAAPVDSGERPAQGAENHARQLLKSSLERRWHPSTGRLVPDAQARAAKKHLARRRVGPP